MRLDGIRPERDGDRQRVDGFRVLAEARIGNAEPDVRGIELRLQTDRLAERRDRVAELSELLVRGADLKMCPRILRAESCGAHERVERRALIVQLRVGQAQIQIRRRQIRPQLRRTLEILERFLRPAQTRERQTEAEIGGRQIGIELCGLAKCRSGRFELTPIEPIPSRLQRGIGRFAGTLRCGSYEFITEFPNGQEREHDDRCESDHDSPCHNRPSWDNHLQPIVRGLIVPHRIAITVLTHLGPLTILKRNLRTTRSRSTGRS